MITKIIKKLISQFRPVQYLSVNISKISNTDLLRNRTALITGGTSGIGFSIAEAFLSNGATVIITGRDQKRINNSCGLLTSKGYKNIYGIILNNKDVSSFEERLQYAQSLSSSPIDILVNNAGVNGHNIDLTTEDEYDNILDTNLKGTFFLSKAVGKYMIKNHIKGNILNIASASSLRPANSPYAISKWGIKGFTLGLAKTLIQYGITVNGIAPGPTLTPMITSKEKNNITNKNIPLGRFILPEEIANMAVFLVSNLGNSIVGDTIYMTGGAGNISIDDIQYKL